MVLLLQAQRHNYLSRGLCIHRVSFDRVFHLRFFGFMTELNVGCSSTPNGAAGDCILATDVGTCSAKLTPEIEKTYVHRVYNAIAPHFSSTRFAKWPKVAAFLNSLPDGSLVLDAGCGNGKYLGLNPQCLFIGCDITAPLVGICADRGHEVIVADAVNLPYRTGFGDTAICIAVLHHLSTENRRRKAIEELVRVVKMGGLVLITVWAVEQEDRSLISKWTPLDQKYVEEWVGPSTPHHRTTCSLSLESIREGDHEGIQEMLRPSDESCENHNKPVEITNPTSDAFGSSSNSELAENHNEYFVPWHLPYHCAEVSGASASAVQNGLAKRDDKKGAVVYNRYYHVFCQGELERLVSDMDTIQIVDQFFDKSNWCIVLEKTK
ncbi:hypothetical protein Droror1_Dr00027259 [Drosera rotundifolia]